MKQIFIALTTLVLLMTGSASAEKEVAPEIEFNFPSDTRMDQYFSEYKHELRKAVFEDYLQARADGNVFHSNAPWFLSVDAKLSYDEKFTAVEIHAYSFRGGAHGIPYLDVLYFSKDSNRPMRFQDLLKPEAASELSRLSRKRLVALGFKANDEWMLKGTKPLLENFRLIVPRKDKVEIVFDAYQVAPYAAGTPKVELSWDELKPLLRPVFQTASE